MSEGGLAQVREPKLQKQFASLLERDRTPSGAAAQCMGVDAELLLDWAYEGSPVPAIDDAVTQFIAAREKRWADLRADTKGGVREQERLAVLSRITAHIDQLVTALGTEAARQVRDLVWMDLNDLSGVFNLLKEPRVCWRCGANVEPPPAEIEAQIEANEHAAAWQAWPPDVFRAKLRAVLRPGDLVVGIRAGAVMIRRPSGEIIEVSRYR
jgi:hypothetical protein